MTQRRPLRTPSCPPRNNPLRAVVHLVPLFFLVAAGCNTPKADTTIKPTSFWPPAPDEPRIQFLAGFEKSADVEAPKSGLDKIILGEDPQQVLPISKPYGLRMWQGKIYVCDIKQKAVIVLDLKKHLTRLIGVGGSTTLQNPTDIAIAPDGTKYIADMSAGTVLVLDANDKQINAFTRKDYRPGAVAVFNDELAVADFKLQRIEILDRRTGSIRRVVGSAGMNDGQFITPISVAYDQQGTLFVSDFMKCRIQKFDRQGQLIKGFGEISTLLGNFVRPKHIVVDRENFLYVVDAAFQNVQIFDTNGRLLTYFGTAGGHPGYMHLPVGVCVSDDPADLALFKDLVHPAFEAKRLVLVTNQFGRNRVGIYALGELKPGKKVSDLAGSRVAVPSATQPSTNPATLPSPPTVEPKEDPSVRFDAPELRQGPTTRPTVNPPKP